MYVQTYGASFSESISASVNDTFSVLVLTSGIIPSVIFTVPNGDT